MDDARKQNGFAHTPRLGARALRRVRVRVRVLRHHALPPCG
jgi:hypothetical protein